MKTRNPKSETGKWESSFTLIEMLAVCAIIAILTGILYPALRTIRDGPKKAQARSDIKKLELAIQAYYNEYGKWPPTPWVAGPDTDAKQFFAMLNGNRYPYDGTALATGYEANNPRGILFMEFSKKQVNSAGSFLDPWGKEYFICLDNGDYAFGATWLKSWWGDITGANLGAAWPDKAPANDGIIWSHTGGGSYTGKRSIGIYSYGPNMQNDDAQGPEYDDITNWY